MTDQNIVLPSKPRIIKEDGSVGIYEIDGDMLKVCFVSADKERPKEFKTEAASDASIHTYKKK